jgi:hypothetical protein
MQNKDTVMTTQKTDIQIVMEEMCFGLRTCFLESYLYLAPLLNCA